MKVARHWVRESAEAVDAHGARHRASAWGWSSSSVEEAARRAGDSAQRVATWLASFGERPAPPASAEYQYALDRPPREEIIEELHDAAGEVSALITRNSYGSLVLNCRELMFIDVDFRPTAGAAVRYLLAMFGRKTRDDSEEAVTERVDAWCKANAALGVRLYRTHAGFRVAIVGRPIAADKPAAERILEELQSDPLYRRLCQSQQTFRARLTPKPWRMGVDNPPSRFPFADEEVESRYRLWQRRYDEAAPRFATCRLMETYGPAAPHPDLAPMVQLHDGITGIERSLPLA